MDSVMDWADPHTPRHSFATVVLEVNLSKHVTLSQEDDGFNLKSDYTSTVHR